MASEKRLETLEEEIRHLKDGLKQTFASVRTHLHSLERTPPNNSSQTESGGNGHKSKSKKKPAPESPVAVADADEAPAPSDNGHSLNEENRAEWSSISHQLGQSLPGVDTLAHLINWIARARYEIGEEQLPAFLEVYGISGHLSPDMKELILHLASLTSPKSGEGDTAAVWSNAMLSLHGILAGGDLPPRTSLPHWSVMERQLVLDENEIIEAKK